MYHNICYTLIRTENAKLFVQCLMNVLWNIGCVSWWHYEVFVWECFLKLQDKENRRFKAKSQTGLVNSLNCATTEHCVPLNARGMIVNPGPEARLSITKEDCNLFLKTSVCHVSNWMATSFWTSFPRMSLFRTPFLDCNGQPPCFCSSTGCFPHWVFFSLFRFQKKTNFSAPRFPQWVF